MPVREVNPLNQRKVVVNGAFTTTGATTTISIPLAKLTTPPKVYPPVDGGANLTITAGLGPITDGGIAVTGTLTITRGATAPTSGLKYQIEVEGY